MGAGTQLYLWECNGQPQQHWTFDLADGTVGVGVGLGVATFDVSDIHATKMYQQKEHLWPTVYKPYNGQACLDYYEDQPNNGQAFHVWDCNGLANQQWHLSEFIPVHTEHLVLAV